MSAWLTATNKLRITRVTSVRTESPTVKTFTFKDRRCAKAKPGQFVMIWIPGVDEIPISVSDANEADSTVSVTVKKIGEATRALHDKKVGDVIGVRGPFGNSFTLNAKKALIVGGGTGIAPLTFAAKRLSSKRNASKIVSVIGAKNIKELLFKDELKKACGEENFFATTEDGSYGFKGVASTLAEQLLNKEHFDIVYTCGPEQMIRKIFEHAEKRGTLVEASLERIMRCAIGICGSCLVGEYRVCKDGPVFKTEQLQKIKDELGVWKRDFDGKKIPL